MNAERLHELVSFLIDQEKRSAIQSHLDATVLALQQLAGNPGETNYQTQLAEERRQLSSAVAIIGQSLTPAMLNPISELFGAPYFTDLLLSRIQGEIDANAMTPQVAYQQLSEFAQQRREYVERLVSLNEAMTGLGIETPATYPGEAELGFLLPREIFENYFSNFATELRQLNRILNTFAELVGTPRDSAQLRQLATTDPWIVVGVTYVVGQAVGRTITWLLDSWKKVLDIKGVYDSAKALKLDKALLDGFAASIEARIGADLDAHAERLVAEYRSGVLDNARDNELRNELRIEMRQLLARMERGMQVELRYLPRQRPGDAAGADADDAKFAAEIKKIANQLLFPKPVGEPLLQLTAQAEGGSASEAKA
jgi:hypothetical protein